MTWLTLTDALIVNAPAVDVVAGATVTVAVPLASVSAVAAGVNRSAPEPPISSNRTSALATACPDGLRTTAFACAGVTDRITVVGSPFASTIDSDSELDGTWVAATDTLYVPCTTSPSTCADALSVNAPAVDAAAGPTVTLASPLALVSAVAAGLNATAPASLDWNRTTTLDTGRPAASLTSALAVRPAPKTRSFFGCPAESTTVSATDPLATWVGTTATLNVLVSSTPPTVTDAFTANAPLVVGEAAFRLTVASPLESVSAVTGENTRPCWPVASPNWTRAFATGSPLPFRTVARTAAGVPALIEVLGTRLPERS